MNEDVYFDAPEFHANRGRDVTPPFDPIGELVEWTEQVRALGRAKELFPQTEQVIDYQRRATYLVCADRDHALEVFHVLDCRAEQLDLLPERAGNRVHILYYDFSDSK